MKKSKEGKKSLSNLKPRTEKRREAGAKGKSAQTASEQSSDLEAAEMLKGVEKIVQARDLGYPAFENDARKWMESSESIPLCPAPILFIRPRLIEEIARTLGRPMMLIEAQCLVKPDGPVTTCLAKKIQFQPVKYLAFVPESFARTIHGRNPGESKFMTEIWLPYGGAYYLKGNRSDGFKIVAFSGAVLREIKNKRGRYELAWGTSPLVVAAELGMKKTGRLSWGNTLHEVEEEFRPIREVLQLERTIEEVSSDIDFGHSRRRQSRHRRSSNRN